MGISVIVSHEGGDYREEASWSDEIIRFGRSAQAEMCIKHRSVTRQHFLLRFDGTNWLVEDTESSNGTTLNGSRIMQPMPLRCGDIIGAGVARIEITALHGGQRSDENEAEDQFENSSAVRAEGSSATSAETKLETERVAMAGEPLGEASLFLDDGDDVLSLDNDAEMIEPEKANKIKSRDSIELEDDLSLDLEGAEISVDSKNDDDGVEPLDFEDNLDDSGIVDDDEDLKLFKD